MVTAETTSGNTPTDTPASPAGSAARLQIRFPSRSRALSSITESHRPSGTSDLLLPPPEKAVQSLASPTTCVQQSSSAQAPALAEDVALDIFATDTQLQLHLQPDLPTENVLPSSDSNDLAKATKTAHVEPISAMLQNAQNMLLRQQQEEASVQAANFACSSSLQQAQAIAAGKQLAYEGYCHLPEVSSKEWYWTQKGTQCGPYSLAELFEMTQVSQTVSAEQDIYNYYDEVSTRIKYKLNGCKGLRAAWDSHQQAEAAITQAAADLSRARRQVQAAAGATAAAAAAVAAVVATEARWDWHASGLTQSADSNQGFTPSELAQKLQAGLLQAHQQMYPVSQVGVPQTAGGVVQGWKDALSYAHQVAAADSQKQPSYAVSADGQQPQQDPIGEAATNPCWAYWDGQQQQGPFALRDFAAWVDSGYYVESMEVYHVADSTTAYTLAQLFSQYLNPQPPSDPLPPLPSDPHAAANGNITGKLALSTSNLPSQHWQQHQHPDLSQHAKAIATQLRQQLQEVGKKAVYDMVIKSIYASVPQLLEAARQERAAEAARAAAEQAGIEAEARAEAVRAAAEKARLEDEARAEVARLKAEAEAKAKAEALEKQQLEAEALARWQREEEEARLAAEAAARAERQRREEARQEARRKKAEEDRIRQEAAAKAAAEAEAKRKAEEAAQQAWQEEHRRQKAETAAKKLAAERQAAADKAAAEKAAAEKAAAEEAAAAKAAAEKAAAEKAAAEAAAREAADKLAEEERKAAEQVRALAAQMAEEKRIAAERAAALAEEEEKRREAIRAKKAEAAQAAREARAAKVAAQKQQQEKAKAARAQKAAAAAAAKAATKAAREEAAVEAAKAEAGAEAAKQAAAAEAAREAALAKAAETSRQAEAGKAPQAQASAQGLPVGNAHTGQHTANGFLHAVQMKQAQHTQQAGAFDSAKARSAHASGKNGFHSPFPAVSHLNGDRHSKQLQSEAAMDAEIDIMYNTPEKPSGVAHDNHHVSSPEVDIVHISSQKKSAQSQRSLTGRKHSLDDSQSVDVDITQISPVAPIRISQGLEGTEGQQTVGVPASEEEFDWAAWQSPEDGPRGIAERLQRNRRPPKRPYDYDPDLDIPKPKLKKNASEKSHGRLQHKLLDRLPRQDSGSTSSEQFAQLGGSQSWQQLPQQHALTKLHSGLSKKASRGKKRGRAAVEEVGCIRAAAYQGEAFLQARLEVLHQQGAVAGNTTLPDADTQAMPHTVRVVGGKQRGHRSAFRDLSRDEAVTDASKWGLLKGRTQDLRFGRSRVHAWGLFAKQDIDPEEFIIEYVGQTIRTSLLDVREKAYERSGLGSSYLFRIDEAWAVDATRQGGLARFINHSCDPNCYTKIITVEGHKHIVIYSKHAIHAGEELTYDYKFEYELNAEAIKCTCGASNCRGRLN